MIPGATRYKGSAPPPPPPAGSVNLANIVDASGNGLDAILGGSHDPVFASDPFGIGQDALIFDGLLTVAAPVVGSNWNPPTSTFTYQFRFKRDTGSLGTTQGIFGRWTRRNGGANTKFGFLCYFDTSNQLNFILSANASAGSAATVHTGAITDGSDHAAMIVMSGGQLSIYLDGTRVQQVTSVSPYAIDPSVQMLFGTYDDVSTIPTGGQVFMGVFGDFMISNIARQTGASYTVPGTPAVSDSHTVCLLPMNEAVGNYLKTPAFQGHALLRTGFSQASGGWANPDGPLPKQGGGWYFTVSAFNGTQWTVWSVTAATLSDLLSGSGTVGASAIQTPASGEGTIAGNGSVVWFKGQYWHFYHDQTPNIRYSNGTDLGAPFSPQPGTVVVLDGFDPFVRVSSDGNTLMMWYGLGSLTGVRHTNLITSTDGVHWTSPVDIVDDMSQAGFKVAPGEFSVTQFAGASQWGFSDGGPSSGSAARNVIGWGSIDGSVWVPLFVRLTASGTGSDAGSHPYLGVYDSSPMWDSVEGHLIVIGTHSTNTQPTQPTDSDIGVWFIDISGM